MTQDRWREAGVPIITFVVGLGTILGAWFSQLVLGFQPCHLCLQERYPYYIGLPIIAIAIVVAFWGAPSRWVRLVMAVAGFVFAISAYLGLNHAGIELNWWPGPSDCSPTGALPKTIEEMMRQINGTRIVPCNQAVWWFLGLSFAGWNAVISAVLTAGCAWAAAGGFSREKIVMVRRIVKSPTTR